MLVTLMVLAMAAMGTDASSNEGINDWDRPAWDEVSPESVSLPWGLVSGPLVAGTCGAPVGVATAAGFAGVLAGGLFLWAGDRSPASGVSLEAARAFAPTIVWWLVVSSAPTASLLILADLVGMAAGEIPRVARPMVFAKDIGLSAALATPAILGVMTAGALIVGVLFVGSAVPPLAKTQFALAAWGIGLAVLAVTMIYWVAAVGILRPMGIVLSDWAMRKAARSGR